MFDIKHQRDRIIAQIISTDRDIKCIYDNITAENKDTLEPELRYEIAKENILLDALNIKEKNSKEMYNAFASLLSYTIYDDITLTIKDKELQKMYKEYIDLVKKEKLYHNDLILSRFESYLIKKFRSEPIKSTNKDKVAALKQDKATIYNQALTDYNIMVMKLLTEQEEASDSIKERNQIINTKNKLLFTNKEVEARSLDNNFEITGYKKCLENGHDEDLVQNIYHNLIAEKINEFGTRCYICSNETLRSQAGRNEFKINLQFLKAGLSFVNTEELEEIYIDYECENLNSKRVSVAKIGEAIQEVIESKKAAKQKTLKKVD